MIAAQHMIGVVLAGGGSTRMGTDKALLEIDGTTMIERVTETLRKVFEEVVVVSNVPVKYRFLDLPVFPDIMRDCGPLGGIHSALTHLETEAVFVVSCDTPFVSEGLIRHLLRSRENHELCVPQMGKQVHPLCGIYQKTALPVITQRLQQRQLRLREIFNVVDTRIIPIGPELPFYHSNLLKNFNTPGEFKQYSQRGFPKKWF
ncbi:MAG: molybdenum cofactor guanylyltransferase [Ignavibacteriales bacterium]|nr:molybdenum cofactor guanylyltransferase [Ignavibacteriales bacterium]